MVEGQVGVEDDKGAKLYAFPCQCRDCGGEATCVVIVHTDIGDFHGPVCDGCKEDYDRMNTEFRKP